ncbi:hypothetical protein AX16_001819 [Volvariella volvacea WC 439]|nr:hypothetical protein AX16_001819 [Volvariella volvacea WC 439]
MLLVLCAVQSLVILVTFPLTLHGAEYDGFCVIKFIPIGAIYFCIGEFLLHATLWGLTVRRYRTALQDGWANIPVLWIVSRDSGWACLAVTGSDSLTLTSPPAFNLFQLP